MLIYTALIIRRSYTADFKLKALRYAETHDTKAMAIQYECSERPIRFSKTTCVARRTGSQTPTTCNMLREED